MAITVAARAEPLLPADTAWRRLQSDLQTQVDAGSLPSVACALVHEGRTVHAGAVGWADKASRVPATAQTAYPLASVSKPIVATAVLALAERGQIDLDAPVARYLPGTAIPGTVRQLLNHTSGLRTYAHIAWQDRPERPQPLLPFKANLRRLPP